MGITLEKKKRENGRFALYLSFCFEHKRWRESLHIMLEPPVDAATRRMNREKMKMAMAIRNKRELDFLANRNNVKSSQRSAGVNWLDIFQEFIEQYQGKDIKMVKASSNYLRLFVEGRPLYSWQLNRPFCSQFYEFLKRRLSGHTPAGYFNKFKQCLDYGVERHLLPANPARNVRVVTQNEFTKAILNADEIARLAATPCPDHEVKRAFLFACNTGLRWCDVTSLHVDAVDLPNRMLHIVQRKVEQHSSKAVLHLALNDSALTLLHAFSPTPDGHVFALPSYSYSRRMLMAWVDRAGIGKHITFHCARHSFVTNLLLGGANIKTASELAGHSTIRHTEKYVHIVDELKRKAVDSLPPLPVEFDRQAVFRQERTASGNYFSDTDSWSSADN